MSNSNGSFAPLGCFQLAPSQIASVITCLEARQAPPPREVEFPAGVSVARVRPGPMEYRHLFRKVGADWLWYSRLLMESGELEAIIEDDRTEIFAIRDGQQNIGMLELDFRVPGECELSFLGLTLEAMGKGIGRCLMNFALEHAWSRDIERMWLKTCTFDSPNALKFYLRSGFTPFAFAIEIQTDPRVTGHLPIDAAPQIPRVWSI